MPVETMAGGGVSTTGKAAACVVISIAKQVNQCKVANLSLLEEPMAAGQGLEVRKKDGWLDTWF